MVGDGESLAAPGVQRFPVKLVLDGEPAFFPEEAVEVDGLVHGGDPVFGKEHHANVTGLVVVDEFRHHLVDGFYLGGDGRGGWAVLLQAVVKMREVNEGEGGRVFFLHPFR